MTMRLVRIAVTTLSLVVGVLAVSAEPAEAASHQYGWSYNICGGNCNSGDDLPVDALIAHLDSATNLNQKPLSIAVQEVCYSQYIGLRDRLASRGYHGRMSQTVDSSDSQCGESQHIAIFSVGVQQGHVNHAYGAQAPSDSNAGRVRKMTCVKMDVYALFAACSTHITASTATFSANRSYKHKQSDEYIYVVNANLGSRWRFIAGDFNYTPDELFPNTSTRAMDMWYTGHWEAAGRLFSTGTHATFYPSNKKLDYVWMAKSAGSAANVGWSEVSALFYGGQSVSDHGLVKGRFLV